MTRRFPMDVPAELVGAVSANATDREWWNRTGNCGGCGDADCHPGDPCTAGRDGCRYCPGRDGDLVPPSRRQSRPDTPTVLPGQISIEDILGLTPSSPAEPVIPAQARRAHLVDETADVVAAVALDDSTPARAEGADMIIAAINAAADAHPMSRVSSRTAKEHLDWDDTLAKQFAALFGHLSRSGWLHPVATTDSGNAASRNATKLVRVFHRPEPIPPDWAAEARRRKATA